MTQVILSTAYFPNIHYFTKVISAEKVYVEAHEHYQRQSYRTRCHIFGANGLQVLSVPIEKHKGDAKITEIRIAYHTPWQKNHWRSIRSAYENSPFFEHYIDFIEPVFKQQYTFLWDLNKEIFGVCCKILGCIPNISETISYEKKYLHDFRNGIHPKPQFAGIDGNFQSAHYHQVFADKHGFQANLSVLDAIFCEGQGAISVIKKSIKVAD
jgi:hypothetical protein